MLLPVMSDFPVERLGYRHRLFSNCSVDYFGPIYVTVCRMTEKRCAFLFTCMSTRAVHVEFVPSMDTSSCAMGIGRFISCPNTPNVV